ncbi:MAG: tetratricopeptide repeat protein [Flavobacteriaceae bacterium]
MKQLIIILFILPLGLFAQEQKDAPKVETPKNVVPKEVNEKLARKYVREGNMLYGQNNYVDAGVAYEKAIENNPTYETAKYNLGNALSEQNRNKEAIAQYELLAKETKDKEMRSKLMHNIGNNYYKEKEYQKSVDAYKNSLRANPKDDETRYNLALAQMMLEDQQNKDKDKDKDQDKKDDQQKDKDKKDQDKKDGDDEKDDKNKGKKDPKDDKKDQQKQPQPGKLSPQQMQQLLDAMANEEKKTQEKMNAKKEKGKKVKQEKDW